MTRITIGWKRLSIALTLIVLSLGMYTIIGHSGSNPSGQTTSIEGGGFCSHGYKIFQFQTNFFAQNCATGVNEDESTSAPVVIQYAFTNLVIGETVYVTAGDYPMGTNSPSVTFGNGGFIFSGDSFGRGNNPVLVQTGTRFLAGANNQVIFQATSGKNKLLQDWMIQNMVVYTNGFTGITALDMTTSSEGSTSGSVIQNFVLSTLLPNDSGNNGQFGTGIILDGNDDLRLINYQSTGLAESTSASSVTDIHWDVPLGTVDIEHPIALSTVMLTGKWQTAYIGGDEGTIGPIIVDGNVGGGVQFQNTIIENAYGANSPNAFVSETHFLNVGGFAMGTVEIDSMPISVANSKDFIFLNGGTIDSFSISNSELWNRDGTGVSITDNAVNLGRYRREVFHTKLIGVWLNNPWQVDANGYLFQANSIQTPGNPSGTTSTTGVMMGLAVPFASEQIGTALIMVTGSVCSTLANDGATIKLYYGTGAAPINGAAITGTQVQSNAAISFTAASNNQCVPFTAQGYFGTPTNGLTIGTLYWFDIVLAANTGGTATVTGLTYSILEYPV